MLSSSGLRINIIDSRISPAFKLKILFFLQLFSINILLAQSGWGPYQKLYSDSKINVEVSFKINKDACNDDESFKVSTFKYRITGEFRSFEYYLNWKLDYIDCNGNLYYQQNSLNIGVDSKAGSGTVDNMGYSPQDVEFTCKSLENSFYEVEASYTSKKGGGLKSLPFSKDPLGIDGEKNIYIGETSTLKVNGGILGIGAKWIWYEGECGKNTIGTGENIEVNPKQTTTYFVRAESAKNITNCASITVNVNQLSIAPTAITGKTNLCKGESTYLTISGGKLGVNAEWIWYKGDCGFNEIGRGQSLTVKPEQTTRYYARAEGKFNKTDCAEVIVTVSERSEKASSILSTKIKCLSEPVTLTAIGGNLAKDAQWVWYNNSWGYGYPIGRGNSITVTPNNDRTYCVRAEGGCNTTECISTEIIAKQISTAPTTIDGYTNPKTKKLELTVRGGTLGTNANWFWYKNSSYKGSPIYKGATLIVSPKKPIYYYVRGEGECNVTPGLSKKVITPDYVYRFTPTYYDKKKPSIAYKTIQIGGGLGIEFNSLSAYTSTITKTTNSYPYNSTDTINENTYILGLGFKGEFMFHPIIKDYFSIGLFANGAVGSTPYIFAGGKKAGLISGNTEQQKYLYYRLDVGTEIAAGYSKVKALVVYKSSMQRHTFSSRTIESLYDETDRSLNFDKQIRRETISIGIRTAPYSVKNERYKRGFCFDFLYHLSRDYEWDWDNAKWNYNALSGFNSGAGMAIWVQSVLKFQLDLLFNSALGSYRAGSNTSVQLSLIYNRNAFY